MPGPIKRSTAAGPGTTPLTGQPKPSGPALGAASTAVPSGGWTPAAKPVSQGSSQNAYLAAYREAGRDERAGRSNQRFVAHDAHALREQKARLERRLESAEERTGLPVADVLRYAEELAAPDTERAVVLADQLRNAGIRPQDVEKAADLIRGAESDIAETRNRIVNWDAW